MIFEYSNLGYGILGRVVTSASGQEYREFVRDRILAPLGMTSTGYLQEEVPAQRLAHGYVRLDETLVREGTDPYGALASMGGVFTSVRDLALWVEGFLDAFPARDEPEGRHPLRRASRREMQQLHRLIPPSVDAHPAHAAPAVDAAGYGYGLVVRSNVELGTFVSHGGGYPGFGTQMAWHPASGIGLIGFANLRYGRIHPVVAEQLTGARPGRRRSGPAGAPDQRRGADAIGRRGPARDVGRHRRRRDLRNEHGPRRAARAASRGDRKGRRRAGPLPAGRGPPARLRLAVPRRLVAARRAGPRPCLDPALAGAAPPTPDPRDHGRS